MHLRRFHTLEISYCNKINITEAAFLHLRGIKVLTCSTFSTTIRAVAATLLAEPVPNLL